MLFSSITLFAAVAFAQKCSLQFDGRIAKDTQPASLDTSASPFNPSYVLGQGLKWSEIIEFNPALKPSLFDGTASKPFTMTINDSSIFAPSATNVQTGFRRAEFLPASNNGADNSTIGVKTLHFSLMSDPARPLNFSHEYQLAFLESADFSTNQFALKTGNILGGIGGNPKTLTLVGNVNENPVRTLFTTPFADGVWHNYALVLDFNALTTQVLYSQGCKPLVNVTAPLKNNIAGRGQFHFGILKKPTGSNLTDITKQGFQPSGIHEAVSFGGISEEDSGKGCISLKP